MSEDIFRPQVTCTFLEGQWYATWRGKSRLMICGPTLTETLAALVVALAHDGKTDPVVWQLSPSYQPGDDDDGGPDEHPADGWGVVKDDGCHE